MPFSLLLSLYRSPHERKIILMRICHIWLMEQSSRKYAERIWAANAILVGPTGLEPVTSAAWGRRPNQLDYGPLNLDLSDLANFEYLAPLHKAFAYEPPTYEQNEQSEQVEQWQRIRAEVWEEPDGSVLRVFRVHRLRSIASSTRLNRLFFFNLYSLDVFDPRGWNSVFFEPSE